jgi:hypothetical protein
MNEPFGAKAHESGSLPTEVTLPMVRRLNAEQDRYLNTARIATALERLNETLGEKPPVFADDTRTLYQHLRAWLRHLTHES